MHCLLHSWLWGKDEPRDLACVAAVYTGETSAGKFLSLFLSLVVSSLILIRWKGVKILNSQSPICFPNSQPNGFERIKLGICT